jgi:hypothetical protein
MCRTWTGVPQAHSRTGSGGFVVEVRTEFERLMNRRLGLHWQSGVFGRIEEIGLRGPKQTSLHRDYPNHLTLNRPRFGFDDASGEKCVLVLHGYLKLTSGLRREGCCSVHGLMICRAGEDLPCPQPRRSSLFRFDFPVRNVA